MNKIVLIISCLTLNLYAEDIDWSKYQTEEDLKALSQEQLMSIPMTEFSRIFYKEGETAKLFSESGIEYMTSFQLSALGYFSNKESKEKLKSFQRALGEEATGILTYGQFEQLNECVTKFRESPVITLANTSVSIYDNYARATAQLVIDDGNDTYLESTDSAMPITSSIITCDKRTGSCDVFTADIKASRFGESNDTYYLSTNQDTYTIDSWSADKIIATDSGNCRSTTMTINQTTNEIIQLTTNNSSADSENCSILGQDFKLARPQIAKSVDPVPCPFKSGICTKPSMIG